MQVTVRLYASVRERVGQEHLDLEVDDGATAGDVLDRLEQDHPDAFSHSDLVLARNREVVGREASVEPGDELAVLPPVSGGQIRRDAVDVDEVVEQVKTPKTGAVVTFTGVVRGRSRGQDVERLDYETYEEMAEANLRDLVDRARDEFDIEDAQVHHRHGSFDVGEQVVVIAVAAAHREAAFEACRWLIDTLKVETPIWKKEHTEDGATWVEDHA